MKKFITTVVCLLALSVTAIPASAQTRSRRVDPNVQVNRYNNNVYRDQRYRDRVNANDVYRYDQSNGRYGYDDRSFWDEHRDKITTAAGAGIGALIGGMAGGKKGAVIGALAGGGGAALYTYKIRDKNDRYRY